MVQSANIEVAGSQISKSKDRKTGTVDLSATASPAPSRVLVDVSSCCDWRRWRKAIDTRPVPLSSRLGSRGVRIHFVNPRENIELDDGEKS